MKRDFKVMSDRLHTAPLVLLFAGLAAFPPYIAFAAETQGINDLIRQTRPTSSNDHRQAGAILDKDELVSLGTQATVLILLGRNGEFAGHGSGFFIAPNLILTNSHVVEGSDSYLVILADGRRLEGAALAAGGANTGNDLGVLSVKDADGITPISLSGSAKALDQVYAFGYPGVAIGATASWQAIMSGDQVVKPEPVVSAGNVQQVTTNDENIAILMHSAKIAGGNSGGPLLDACGNAAGINTYLMMDAAPIVATDGQAVTVGEGENRKETFAQVDSGFGFAISVVAVLRFLEERELLNPAALRTC